MELSYNSTTYHTYTFSRLQVLHEKELFARCKVKSTHASLCQLKEGIICFDVDICGLCYNIKGELLQMRIETKHFYHKACYIKWRCKVCKSGQLGGTRV